MVCLSLLAFAEIGNGPSALEGKVLDTLRAAPPSVRAVAAYSLAKSGTTSIDILRELKTQQRSSYDPDLVDIFRLCSSHVVDNIQKRRGQYTAFEIDKLVAELSELETDGNESGDLIAILLDRKRLLIALTPSEPTWLSELGAEMLAFAKMNPLFSLLLSGGLFLYTCGYLWYLTLLYIFPELFAARCKRYYLARDAGADSETIVATDYITITRRMILLLTL